MKKYLQTLFLFFFSVSLLAQNEDNQDKPSYHKGKILTDISIASLGSEVSSRSNPNTFTSLYFLYDVRPLLLSSNTQSVDLGLYKYASYSKPEIQNYNSRLGVEYAIFDWLGIGASVSATRVRITKITPGSYLTATSSYFLPTPPNGKAPTINDYFSFSRQEFRINFATIDLEASLHYPYKIFDPYFRFGYGVTPGYPGVYKSSIAGGLRIFWDNFYLQTEYIQDFLYGIRIQQTDYLLERGFRLGIGYSWL